MNDCFVLFSFFYRNKQNSYAALSMSLNITYLQESQVCTELLVTFCSHNVLSSSTDNTTGYSFSIIYFLHKELILNDTFSA